jgi:hypothetical protein
MFTLIHDFFYSPERARLWLRSVLAWVAVAGAQIVVVPREQIATWSARDWAIRLGVAALAGLALGVKAGDRNPPVAP